MRELRKSLKALSHNEYRDLTLITVCNCYLLLTIDYLIIKNERHSLVSKKFILSYNKERNEG